MGEIYSTFLLGESTHWEPLKFYCSLQLPGQSGIEGACSWKSFFFHWLIHREYWGWGGQGIEVMLLWFGLPILVPILFQTALNFWGDPSYNLHSILGLRPLSRPSKVPPISVSLLVLIKWRPRVSLKFPLSLGWTPSSFSFQWFWYLFPFWLKTTSYYWINVHESQSCRILNLEEVLEILQLNFNSELNDSSSLSNWGILIPVFSGKSWQGIYSYIRLKKRKDF